MNTPAPVAMDTASRVPASPLAALASIIRHRRLIGQLVKRDFLGRYRGSMLGVAWSLFNPLLMLAIYTFVFSVAFNVRWGHASDSRTAFAVVLFAGMIVHAMLAECLNRAPTLVVEQANFVKKVVFPLEVLPVVVLASALLHFAVSFLVLLAASGLLGEPVNPLGALLVPVLVLPLALLSLGACWVLASLGVYLRDLAQVVGMVSTVLLFLGPVFYPVEALPEHFRWILRFNPLTMPITELRNVVLFDRAVDWPQWWRGLVVGAACFCAGFWWFQRSRKGFSDVL